jgi:hypothetical protein
MSCLKFLDSEFFSRRGSPAHSSPASPPLRDLRDAPFFSMLPASADGRISAAGTRDKRRPEMRRWRNGNGLEGI